MARNSFRFEKSKRELAQQKKRNEKMQRKLTKRTGQTPGNPAETAPALSTENPEDGNPEKAAD